MSNYSDRQIAIVTAARLGTICFCVHELHNTTQSMQQLFKCDRRESRNVETAHAQCIRKQKIECAPTIAADPEATMLGERTEGHSGEAIFNKRPERTYKCHFVCE